MSESIHTIIVGGGQAGLSASYYLKQLGREHLILDRATQSADAWRNQRWDSFTLVTPNMSFRMPGAEYDGPDPHGYMPRDEVVGRFEDYIQRFDLPISYGIPVQSIQPEDGTDNYVVKTPGRVYRARNVVVANGWFHESKTPSFASKIPSTIFQINSSSYHNPRALPPGAVLVVGAAQSGAQIAEELYQSGRKVYLATGGAPRAPRRYRGKDIFEWLSDSGFFDRPIETFTDLPGRIWVAPQVTGREGGHNLNLNKFYRDGVTLLGHALDFVDGRLVFSSDLKENLARSDRGEKFILKNVDEYIRKAGLSAPEEQLPLLDDALRAPEITSLDLHAAGIVSIIWACGFHYDSSILHMPVLDEYGYPITHRGVSPYPGLYFVGIPFLSKLKSGFIFGVAEDAAYIAQHISDRH
jgi:putative flavoprotein involved in K+ transport